jgi:hypothetical protein
MAVSFKGRFKIRFKKNFLSVLTKLGGYGKANGKHESANQFLSFIGHWPRSIIAHELFVYTNFFIFLTFYPNSTLGLF